MNLEKFYFKINKPCTILDRVRDFIPHAKWTWVPYMNLAINFPADLIKRDEFLNSIPGEFKPTLRLYKFFSNSMYNWHRDAAIGCSFNMVLEDYNSYTLFNKENKINIVNNFIELTYEKEKWHLFNSQQLHAVVNLDPRDRYLLTVSFPKSVKYDQLLEWVKNEQG